MKSSHLDLKHDNIKGVKRDTILKISHLLSLMYAIM
ncbi:hypothetical protein FOQG_00572 [Fusarium oxysporum f. sp. raphani 54005]|uniref:Uncharacterized protein n=5 Tax=Fusarium oxysporum TaxID=5507 RepID=X0D0Q4_FUSOX|nr:hypothetical protein FOXG_18186 [Fusarium oxysporum f. sp. lycopersici 4287]EXA50192.1 hypothetical protein FOVG_03005 [Fusarium oxysporum f. sp. pisi HDV247]EXK42298.1 hypothetical protein FOMG_05311 [Fusarium oxysporum f. sp. melonis 26406]EXL00366.1 hypothetical protein FOQG_00572 [Fusarium oxysporum f. sp. raphani 54005]EXL85887.1 hypothetical protein FOPG_02173 [Fusarium oxysporum f. sp. conglutinans race 2 54008]KAI8414973.1 hypothetical protein FOFC_04593 [Fusarium oxysporum]